ncbi:MAG: putative quinol monooxygenase [Pseudomonadota bacterium]
MYAVTVHFSVRSDTVTAFLPLMLDNAATSLRDEPGCHQFDVCWNDDEPAEIFLYEIYQDRAAFDAHLNSSHFQRFDTAVADMVVAKSAKTFQQVQHDTLGSIRCQICGSECTPSWRQFYLR